MKLPRTTAVKCPHVLIMVYLCCWLSTGLGALMYDQELLSSVAYFNRIHNTSLTEGDYREKFQLLPNKKYYNFIFGFSTGHVGTKSLSEPKLYDLGSCFDENSLVRVGFEGGYRLFHCFVRPSNAEYKLLAFNYLLLNISLFFRL
jgi:hypothetical protein